MDLETPDTPPETPPVETPPEPVAETPPPEPVEPEPEGAIDVDGQRHVPVAVLVEERKRGQALKAKADQFDQLAGYVNQVRPYIDFLAANPNLIARTQQETQPTPPATEQPQDAKAEQLARTLDLYTADGQPDVKRAQVIREMVRSEATEQAEAQVRPLHERSLRQQADVMYQRALVTKTPDGRAPDRAVLDAIWSRTADEIKGTEEGAAGIVAIALGLTSMQGGAKPAPLTTPPPANPPLHTEPPGSRTTTRAPMSALDQSIARLRNMDEKTYAERAKGFTPGRPSVLEDN